MQRKWPLNTNIQQVTTHMHSSFWMFSLNEQHQTLDCFYSTRFLSLPWSIKCITQMSDVNPGFFCTSTHSLSCSAQTGYFSFSPMPSGLCCGSAISSRGLTTVSQAFWEHTLYISCHSLTCGRKGQVFSHVCLWSRLVSPSSTKSKGGRNQPGEDKQIHSEVSC